MNKDPEKCSKNYHGCCICHRQIYNVDPSGFVRNHYMSWTNHLDGRHYMHWHCYEENKKSLRCVNCNISLSSYEHK